MLTLVVVVVVAVSTMCSVDTQQEAIDQGKQYINILQTVIKHPPQQRNVKMEKKEIL